MPIAHVNGGSLHYRDAGTSPSSGDAVVLLHAFPLHSGMWTRQIAALEARHRVIAPDYRGMGRSSVPPEALTMEVVAEDLRALLGHVRVERAAVVGLSMGGYACFELYRRWPGLFRGLILCDTRAAPDTAEAAEAREKFARTAIEKGLGWVADEMMPKLLRPSPDAAVVKEFRHLVGGATPAGVAASQRGMARRPDSTPTLSKITCPVLFLVGEHDAAAPPAEAEKMSAAVKGSRVVRISNAGHLSNLENPAAFDEALTGFVDGLPA